MQVSAIYGHVSYPIVLSARGVHSKLDLTVNERLDHLNLHVAAWVSNQVEDTNIRHVIENALTLERTDPCSHAWSDPLHESVVQEVGCGVISTSVAAPEPADGIGISMTRGNAEAQLLCCTDRSILLQDRCLNCGMRQAVARDCNVSIVR